MAPLAGPLAFAIGLMTPSPSYGELMRRFGQRTPYAAAMPAQVAFLESRGLRPTLDALAGSEAWTDQVTMGAPSSLPAVTDGLASRVVWPLGMFVPHLPAELVEGRGTGYVTDAYNKGWVRLNQAGRTSWGGSAGIAAHRPVVRRDTLLEPTDRTPSARTMSTSHATTNKGQTRLSDMFGD